MYNLTDVPSFVSGDYLVYFDPHACNLPGANAAQPGLKISLASGSLYAQFPDQFSPFELFGCSAEGKNFPGTLFRLPLRSEACAKRSDIKKSAYVIS